MPNPPMRTRMSDPSLGLYSAPEGEHQVLVYHMDQKRKDAFLGDEVPTVWGPAATDGVTPLVAPLHMLGKDGDGDGDVDGAEHSMLFASQLRSPRRGT